MAYAETRIVIGCLTYEPLLIFIDNFIKGKFGIKTEEAKHTLVKEEPIKIIELKNTLFQGGKAETIKELLNKLDNIKKKADKICEKVEKKKRVRRRKKE